MEALTVLLAAALREAPCALGFEAALFVPHERGLDRLTSARVGEGNRSWSVAMRQASVAVDG